MLQFVVQSTLQNAPCQCKVRHGLFVSMALPAASQEPCGIPLLHFAGKGLLGSLLPHLQGLHCEDLRVVLMWCTYFSFQLASWGRKYKEDPVRCSWTTFGWGLINCSDKFSPLPRGVSSYVPSPSLPYKLVKTWKEGMCPRAASSCAIGWLQQKIRIFEPEPKFLVRRATAPSGFPCSFPFKTQEQSGMV